MSSLFVAKTYIAQTEYRLTGLPKNASFTATVQYSTILYRKKADLSSRIRAFSALSDKSTMDAMALPGFITKTINRFRPQLLYQKRIDGKDVKILQYKSAKVLSFGGPILQSYSRFDRQLPPIIWNYFLLTPYFCSPQPARFSACLLGLGGGTVANLYAKYFPKASVTGVEIDAEIIALAKRFFGLNKRTIVICDDAMHYLRTTKARFNVILVDLADEHSTVPLVWHTQFLQELPKHLKPGGAVMINYLGKHDGYTKIATFLRANYPSTFVLPIIITTLKNKLLIATIKPVSITEIKQRIKGISEPDFTSLKRNLNNTIKQL